jgi:hypothetical protein
MRSKPSVFISTIWWLVIGISFLWLLLFPFETFLPRPPGGLYFPYVWAIWILAYGLTLLRNKIVLGIFFPGRRTQRPPAR